MSWCPIIHAEQGRTLEMRGHDKKEDELVGDRMSKREQEQEGEQGTRAKREIMRLDHTTP